MCGARIQLRDSRCYVIDMPSYGEVPRSWVNSNQFKQPRVVAYDAKVVCTVKCR